MTGTARWFTPAGPRGESRARTEKRRRGWQSPQACADRRGVSRPVEVGDGKAAAKEGAPPGLREPGRVSRPVKEGNGQAATRVGRGRARRSSGRVSWGWGGSRPSPCGGVTQVSAGKPNGDTGCLPGREQTGQTGPASECGGVAPETRIWGCPLLPKPLYPR
ncbi:hypothetical protein GCM10009603_22050 [Nocardiopsis exhalans]